MEKSLLDQMDQDFQTNPEEFNYRSYLLKIKKDPVAENELNILYPNVPTLGEKIYLYIRKLDETPSDCKNKIFKGFEYRTLEEIKNMSIKPRNKPMNSKFESNIPKEEKQPMDEGVITSKQELLMSLDEELFLNTLEKSTLVHIIFSRNPGTCEWPLIGNFYLPNENMVYFCSIPHNFNQNKFIELLSKKYENCIFDTKTFPLNILIKLLDRNIQTIGTLKLMNLIKKYQHILY